MTATHPQTADPAITTESVETYLQKHPDFFIHHTDLLEKMEIPHEPEGTVSLVRRQITNLRERNDQLEQKLLDLVVIARENEKLSNQLHEFSLALIEADTLDDVIAVSHNQLMNAFKTDFVRIGLFTDDDISGVNMASATDGETLFGSLIKAKRNFCGALANEQNQYLFGDNADEVESVAFVPLHTTKSLGFLAMGSRDIARFRQGMGTLFLEQLGELVTRAIVHRQNHAATDPQ